MVDILNNIKSLDKKKKKELDFADTNPLGVVSAPQVTEVANIPQEQTTELANVALDEPSLRTWFEEQKEEINKRFDSKEKATQKREAIQTLTNAITQLGASIAGQKSGVDMSNLNLVKKDFGKELDRLSARREAEESGLRQELGARRRLGELMAQRKERRTAKEEEQAAKAGAVAVQREQLELKKAMSDPDSEQSLQAQAAVKNLTGRDVSGFSAEQLKAALPSLMQKKLAGKGIELTEAQKQVDKTFAKDYADYVAGGGASDIQRQLGELKEVSESLGEIDTASGGFIGVVPKAIRDIITPEGSALQDIVESVVQRNLRIILGAQFTEKEGKRLIERAYNPRLDESVNKKRVDNLINQIQQAADAKQAAAEYYEKNGTLQGFKGKVFSSANDFLKEGEEAQPAKQEGPEPGTVVDGYKFKGGDPANAENWEKV
jgi:hypothetical protein